MPPIAMALSVMGRYLTISITADGDYYRLLDSGRVVIGVDGY